MRLRGFFSTPPRVRAGKNYSRPGICSGRVELKSLSWAWQSSRRSRQRFQGQPWRLRSSRLTLQGRGAPRRRRRPRAPLLLPGGWGVLRGGWVAGCCRPPPQSQRLPAGLCSERGGGQHRCQRVSGQLMAPAPGAGRATAQGWLWEGAGSGPEQPLGSGLRNSARDHRQEGPCELLLTRRGPLVSPSGAATLSVLDPAHLAATALVPLSPAVPGSMVVAPGDASGTACPAGGSCLPQPHHALILPRPASTAAVPVISSQSPCASPLVGSRELGSARPAGRMLVEGSFAAALAPSTQPVAVSVLSPATGTVRGPCPCREPAAVEAGGGESARLGGEVGHRARSWSVSDTDGIVSAGKNYPAPLKNPGAATRPRGLRWRQFPRERSRHSLPSPSPSAPGPGCGGPWPPCVCHRVPTAWSQAR